MRYFSNWQIPSIMDLNVITIFLTTACLFSSQAFGSEREAIDDERNTICYGDMGCFEKKNAVFTLDLFPSSPDIIDTKFRLFTRQNVQDTMFQLLRVEDAISIANSSFDRSKPTKMVVHGFRSSGLEPWMMTMKNELLKTGDFNVILIDWGNGAKVDYNQVTVNTRVVGAVIAKLITVLKEQEGADPVDFHIIGHSLGAHIGGYVGERLPNLGRITGLDPAALNFQNKDKMVRLDPTDAKFVDVIHTDGRSILLLGFGMFEPIGHVDYYPNGGLVQPGCIGFSLFGNNVACRHLRAYEYFIESINSACPFRGYRCQSYQDFKRGDCIPCSDEGCGYMGFHADRVKPHTEATNITYFLDTGDSKPFCRYHYQIKVSLGNVSDSKTENGKFMVNLIGSKGQLREKSLTSGYMDIEPGKTYWFIVTSINDLGTVSHVTLSWLQKKKTPGKIYIEQLQIVNGESSKIATSCDKNAEIALNITQCFITCC